MPKTPKVPRPPVVDGEPSGLSANEMQSLMHSDDRASGFSTKGHIDLRELDADPAASDAVTARPRAPSLPADATDYEAPTNKSSRPGAIVAVVGLAAIAAVAAYFVVDTNNRDDATHESELETAAVGVEDSERADDSVEGPAPAAPEEAAQAAPAPVEESTAEIRKALPEDSKSDGKEAALGRTVSRVQADNRQATPKKAEPSTAEMEALDTDDIARRAAAVRGDDLDPDQSAGGAAESSDSVGGAVDDALTDKPNAPKSIDELLDTATGSSDEFEENKPEPPSPSGDAPSKADVSKVMGQLMPGFRSCAGAQVGVATALVAVKSSGDVVSVHVSGTPFGGTRQGQCMEDVIKRRARFGPFKKTRFEFRYPIRIDP